VSTPPTDRQLASLRDLGVTTTPRTRREAAGLIYRARRQAPWANRPVSDAQVEFLERLGAAEVPGTYWEASRLIQVLQVQRAEEQGVLMPAQVRGRSRKRRGGTR
jgi:hypothetical protein